MALHAVTHRYSTDAAALDAYVLVYRHDPALAVAVGDHRRQLVLAEDGGPGALLVLDAAEPDEVAALLDKDPFHDLSLIVGREIRRNPAFGGVAAGPGAPARPNAGGRWSSVFWSAACRPPSPRCVVAASPQAPPAMVRRQPRWARHDRGRRTRSLQPVASMIPSGR